MRFIIVLLVLSLSGCANCKGTTFWGWGKYKDKDIEIESTPPVSLKLI